ncbi:HNH endonuclease [Tomitella gaofuii]|uniref:HNH endonuclease n=1 Tax=Tomitella gaofuii TaxID=2760083 RepID=UPI001C710C34|nr:HNH endonuclease signature motif containing protein [Tomitella gaofuii]
MSAWIVTIGAKFPEHWDFAVEDGFWDLTKRKNIAEGDEVFFWQSGRGLVGWTRVTEDLRPIDDGMTQARWKDRAAGKYRTRFGISLVSDVVEDGVSWKVIRENTGITQPLSNGQLEVKDPASIDYLRGLFAPEFGSADVGFPRGVVEPMVTAYGPDDVASASPPFTADPDEDSREFEGRVIATRRGQPQFRKALLDAYVGRCAVTGCSAVSALEAAHILPYRGEQTNDVRNGLLLRADIHTLFDLFLITVAEDLTIRFAPQLAGRGYDEYDGRALRLPVEGNHRPSADALAHHRARCKWL